VAGGWAGADLAPKVIAITAPTSAELLIFEVIERNIGLLGFAMLHPLMGRTL
jgi:hypothetical protein